VTNPSEQPLHDEELLEIDRSLVELKQKEGLSGDVRIPLGYLRKGKVFNWTKALLGRLRKLRSQHEESRKRILEGSSPQGQRALRDDEI